MISATKIMKSSQKARDLFHKSTQNKRKKSVCQHFGKKVMPSCFAAKGHTLSFHYLNSVS